MHIGCHLSAAAGYLAMVRDALSIQADTFQFFTRNPRGGAAKELDKKDLSDALALMHEHHFAPLVAHAPYTLNPCSADERVRDFAARIFTADLEILEHLPGNYYNFHPGSHVGQGVEKGIELTADLLNLVLKEDYATGVLLETMAGKGSEIGSTFEELRAIIDRTEKGASLGVCLDTCHVFCAGYDIVNNLDRVLEDFDRILGLTRLKAIHLNDSMKPFASRKDRHEKIGKGEIGLEAILHVVNHPALRDLVFLLETPHDDLSGYAHEIAMLRRP